MTSAASLNSCHRDKDKRHLIILSVERKQRVFVFAVFPRPPELILIAVGALFGLFEIFEIKVLGGFVGARFGGPTKIKVVL